MLVSIGYGAFTPARNLGLAAVIAATIFTISEPARAEPVTIAILGDSLVQGYGLPADQGFVPQLQNWLNSNGVDAMVLNAGVSGDTTAGGLARVDWTLTPDVDALVVAFGGNDVLRGLDPAAARANLDGILKVAQTHGLPVLLVGIVVPGNYGTDYKAAFEAIYTDLSRQHDTMLYPNFLLSLTSLPDRAATLAQYFQPDGLHPNSKGVGLIVESIGPEIANLAKIAIR